MLALGSIVYLQNGRKKLMILNRGPVVDLGEGNVYFDYAGCLYPHGLFPEKVYYFNEENIDKVIFNGYVDEEEARFQELYEKWIEKEGSVLPKGRVTFDKN